MNHFRTFHSSPICTFHRSRKTCTWLDEQFGTFHPFLHESITIYRVNNFIKKEIPAKISCEFCEISPNTIFKEPFGRLLPHKHSFCLLSRLNLLFFQKRCHIYFPAECFLGLIYRLGTRISSIFQTLCQAPIFNPVKHLQRSFFFENS